jgi:hypothetical protein
VRRIFSDGGRARRAEALGYVNKGRLRGLIPKLYVTPVVKHRTLWYTQPVNPRVPALKGGAFYEYITHLNEAMHLISSARIALTHE